MTKRTMHLCAAAFGLLLSVPATARGQDVKESRQPASQPAAGAASAPAAAGKRPASARPTAVLGPAPRAALRTETRVNGAKARDVSERFRKRRSQH